MVVSPAQGDFGTDPTKNGVIPLARLRQGTLDVVHPVLRHHLLQDKLAEELGRVAFGELDHLLGDQGQMAHVSHPGLVLGLRLFASKLAVDDLVGDVGGLEQADGERRVEAPVHRAVEDLLDDIVHHIVKKVIPRVPEEEAEDGGDNSVLDELHLQVVANNGLGRGLTVGSGRWCLGHDDRNVSSVLARLCDWGLGALLQ